MNTHHLANQLGNLSDESLQIHAVEKVKTDIHDDRVLDMLCTMAVSPVHARVRETILKVLQPVADKANQWFVRAAIQSSNKNRRQLALLNLSLLECRLPEARAVVLQGLTDPDRNIQHAAALSAGYFEDPEFLDEVVRFLERNRFIIACTGLQRTIFHASRPKSGLPGHAEGAFEPA